MKMSVAYFAMLAVIGQISAQNPNQQNQQNLGYQANQYANNNNQNINNQNINNHQNNIANQLNNVLRQAQQENTVNQFRQNQYAQQNLAAPVFQKSLNVPQVVSAQALGAQQLPAQNQPVQNVAKVNVDQVDTSNQNVGGVVKSADSLKARLANQAFVRPDQAAEVLQQQGKIDFNHQFQNQNTQNIKNQVNQQPESSQDNHVNIVKNNDNLNNQNIVNQMDQSKASNQVNLAQKEASVYVPKPSVVLPAQTRVNVQRVETGDADRIAQDDRQRSARLEQHVDTAVNNDNNGHTNNDNNNNNNNANTNVYTNTNNNHNNDDASLNNVVHHEVNAESKMINPEVVPINNDNINNNNNVNNNNNNNAGFDNFNGGGVNVNLPENNFRRQPERDIGGIRLTWDWTDFAISFDDYGGAEMKVRRAPHATTGEPWPLPQYYVKKENRVFKLDKDVFTFKVIGETCDIITEAVERYRTRVLEDAVEDMYDNLQNAPGTNVDDPSLKYESDIYTRANTITKVDIKIRKPCAKYPSVHSDESYDLVVKKSRAFIWANEVWGALKGLETFSHIVWKGLDGEDPEDRGKNANLFVKETVISDYPRFPHRGILVDSSRHFFFKETIFDILDGMEQNKMNVLHWHIVDDQSFPYQSAVYPDLSRKGAFHPTFVYTQKDIAEIIDYARFRGIRVMPEFDTPGHTYSWGLSRPELLTQCYQGGSPVKGYLGPIDPTKNSTYSFLKNFFGEVLDTFKDQYIHLGGDEVPLGCWQSNPDVVNFGTELSKQHGSVSQQQYQQYNNYYPSQFDVRKVYEYYENRLMKDLRDIGKHRKDGVKFVMWQEVMNNDLQLPNDTIIEVWMGDMADVNRAISMGYQVLYATCWYLDHVDYGTKWPKYYQCDPADNTFGYMIDEKKVLGGEACLWSEYIDNENMMTTMWPRSSAVAERLWSAKDVRDLDSAGARLSEHRCRMLNRGLSIAQISGPDYCLKRGVGRSRDKYRTNSTCTSGRCVKSRDPNNPFVDIDSEAHMQQRLAKMADCPKPTSHSGVAILLGTFIVVLLAVGLGVKSTSGRLSQARVLCRNRTILFLFVSLLCIYLVSYTSIWIQVFDFASLRKQDSRDNLGYKH